MSDDLQHYMERCGELSRELSGALVALAQERRDKETYRTAWNRAEELLAQERGKADAVRRSNAALVEALDAERARGERLQDAGYIVVMRLMQSPEWNTLDADEQAAIHLLTTRRPPAPYLGPGNVVG